MAKNLSLNFFYFFTRNEVGIWSDSYHSARIHSECVGEGKVLWESYNILSLLSSAWNKSTFRLDELPKLVNLSNHDC